MLWRAGLMVLVLVGPQILLWVACRRTPWS